MATIARDVRYDLISDIQLDVPTDISFAEFVLQRAEKFGDRIALVDGQTGRSCTYKQLHCDVIRLAAALHGIGVGRGDRVCILLNNCVEYPMIMLGVLQLGAICVPANYLYTKFELRDLVSDCKPNVYITRSEQIGNICYAMSSLSNSHLTQAIVTIDEDGATELCCHSHQLRRASLRSLMHSVPTADRSQDIELERIPDNRRLVALICYSSGTTGKPKGCMQSHHALIANGCMNNVTFFANHFGSLASPPTPVDEVTVAVLPLFHIYAIDMYLTHALTTGFKVVTIPRFDRDEFLAIVNRYKVTRLHVVPPLLTDLFNNTDESRLRCAMSSVRVVISAAVSLSDHLFRQFIDRLPNARICQLYGMTEIMVSHGAPPETWKHGSLGRLMPNVRARIVDVESRQPVSANIDGEILIKSPCVFTGYWGNDEATRNSFDAGGWLKTGDVGHFDEDGNFFIIDRIKDLIKYKGHSVGPAEIEAVLLLHPDVIDAAVVGIKDDNVGDLPRAYVVTRSQSVSTADITSFVNERIAPYKRIRAGILIVDHIPRGPSGKILRRLLVSKL